MISHRNLSLFGVGAGGLLVLLCCGGPPGDARGAAVVGSVLGAYDLPGGPDARWELPPALSEISGAATTADGRLLVHGDEQALIFELDPRRGEIVKRFAFGDPAVRGDFEGITVADERVYLTTSDGVIYAGPEGRDGEAVRSEVYHTGLGTRCEIEGLTFEPADRTLLLSCKKARSQALRGWIAVFRWSVDRHVLLPDPRPLLPLSAVTRRIGGEEFRISDLVRDPGTGHYLLLAGPERAIAEITPEGQVVAVARLRAGAHRQAEALAMGPDGALLVGDEAAGKRATLSVYRRAR